MKKRLSISIVGLLVLAAMPAYAGGVVRLAEEPKLTTSTNAPETSKKSDVAPVAYQKHLMRAQYAEPLPGGGESVVPGQPFEGHVVEPQPPVAQYHHPEAVQHEMVGGPTYPVAEPFQAGHAQHHGQELPPFMAEFHPHQTSWAGPVAGEFDYGCSPNYVLVPRKKCCYRQPTFLGMGHGCAAAYGRSCNTCCNGYCVGRGNKYCNDGCNTGCCKPNCCKPNLCGPNFCRPNVCGPNFCRPNICNSRHCTQPVGNNCWNNGGGNQNHCCHPCYSTGLRTHLNDLLFW